MKRIRILLPLVICVPAILLLSACKHELTGPYDIANYEDLGYFRIDARHTKMRAPLKHNIELTLPPCGIDTVIYFDYPGLVNWVNKIRPIDGEFEDFFPGGEVGYVEFEYIYRISTLIPVSYTVEPYIWEYRPTEFEFNEISVYCDNPMSLRLIIGANDTDMERRYTVCLLEEYLEPRKDKNPGDPDCPPPRVINYGELGYGEGMQPEECPPVFIDEVLAKLKKNGFLYYSIHSDLYSRIYIRQLPIN